VFLQNICHFFNSPEKYLSAKILILKKGEQLLIRGKTGLKLGKLKLTMGRINKEKVRRRLYTSV